ncbi:unnamed protein product [Heligmosomoides polygyrus]|uniref:DUF1778 domain-containing protein n=1 Tax=Heligmosomoides polygyrus TaxID=6339 RepID=A0A183G625_HELPZ|nr:unnamed protein product [Heligmosomoides polygyrus]
MSRGMTAPSRSLASEERSTVYCICHHARRRIQLTTATSGRYIRRNYPEDYRRCISSRSSGLADNCGCNPARSNYAAESSPTPVFKRQGYAKQYDFKMSLIRKLIPLQSFEEINTVVTDMAHDLNVRNETLKIADEHSEAFQYLETKSKGDSLRSTDPKLSEFMDSIKKR